MSLFQNTVTLFYVISHVLCVSSFMASPIEVTAAVTEVVIADNDFYHFIMSALHRRVSMDYINGEQDKARMKKSLGQLEVAMQMGPVKLLKLIGLTFRNMLSKKTVEGDPALKPQDAAKTISQMLQKQLAILKWKKPNTTTKYI